MLSLRRSRSYGESSADSESNSLQAEVTHGLSEEKAPSDVRSRVATRRCAGACSRGIRRRRASRAEGNLDLTISTVTCFPVWGQSLLENSSLAATLPPILIQVQLESDH
jgi:hypothetical protein